MCEHYNLCWCIWFRFVCNCCWCYCWISFSMDVALLCLQRCFDDFAWVLDSEKITNRKKCWCWYVCVCGILMRNGRCTLHTDARQLISAPLNGSVFVFFCFSFTTGALCRLSVHHQRRLLLRCYCCSSTSKMLLPLLCGKSTTTATKTHTKTKTNHFHSGSVQREKINIEKKISHKNA